MFENLIASINDALYTYLLIIILVAGGLYFSIRTGFVQFRLFGEQIRAVTEKPKDGKGVSSFQALMVSTASRVGTGNIVGVSTALCLGGFGSVFWMWVIALLGMGSAFMESTLAQIYKRRGPEGSYGGPAYYIESAFKGKFGRILAIVFAVFLILTYGVGFNMLASYNLQSTFSGYSFYNDQYAPWIIGLILAVIVGYCLFGGFTGSCVMYGIKRGLFSNEAGVGSAPNASASADVAHPVKQGLVQVLSVFIDTILICTATAFMCMCSGVEPSEELSGAPYVQASLSETLGQFGPIFITVAMILFAFTTLLGNLYYVDQCLYYILGRVPGKTFMHVYHVIASLVVFVGAGLSADMLWNISDVLMGGMTLINMPVILILSKYVIRALKNYSQQRKAGEEPVFHAKDIDLPHKVDYWD